MSNENVRKMRTRIYVAILGSLFLFSGCATVVPNPYTGSNPSNDQFERGKKVYLLDAFGDLISKLHQLLFWNRNYGNHQVSVETERMVQLFLKHYDLKDVKVSINQWAPHREIGRLITNKKIAWPYKILFFPSTLYASLIGRPFSGLLISDYYDPGTNTIHLFSDDVSIALHEAGHAFDFDTQKYRGTYGLIRIVPGINLVQEANATEEAMFFLEQQQYYDYLIEAPKTLYPAYATYVASYISGAPLSLIGAVLAGHHFGRLRASDIRADLLVQGKLVPAARIEDDENYRLITHEQKKTL